MKDMENQTERYYSVINIYYCKDIVEAGDGAAFLRRGCGGNLNRRFFFFRIHGGNYTNFGAFLKRILAKRW